VTKSYLGDGRGLRLGDHRNDRWRDDAEPRPDGYSDVDGCIAGI
jgi:hypothetical protein